jgi:membrane associated rhomboid family serine protease
MFPVRDDAPRSSTPYVTYALLALNILVFLFEIALAPRSRAELIYQFGLVPAALGEASLLGIATPFLTSMFLHASWLHLITNMWALWIFGDNIEGHLGSFRYLALYLICGIAAALLQTVFDPNSQVPMVGASGAIAGIMGAYFLLFPSARVLTLIPIGIVFIWLPAWVMLGYWFLAQFVYGAATSITRASTSSGGVAFWAHVGGFIAGIALIKIFPARPRSYLFEE